MLGRGGSPVLPRAACAHVRQWQMASRLQAELFPALPPPPARGAGLPPSLRSTAQAWPRGRLRVGALGTPAGRGSRPREGTQWVERARPWRPEGTDGGPRVTVEEWRGGDIEVVRDAAALATMG